MQRFFSTFKRIVVSTIFVLGFAGLVGVTIAPQPSYATAAPQSTSQEVISPDSQNYATREEAYEKAIEAAKDPSGLEKEYEKDLKMYKEAHPDQGGLVEQAKEVVEKVVGKDS